jgi:hypothetical protein
MVLLHHQRVLLRPGGGHGVAYVLARQLQVRVYIPAGKLVGLPHYALGFLLRLAKQGVALLLLVSLYDIEQALYLGIEDAARHRWFVVNASALHSSTPS